MHTILPPAPPFVFRLLRWPIIVLALVLFAPLLGQAQVKIMPFGASTTQGDANYNSYRRALWQKLQAGNYSVDFVGSQKGNYNAPTPNPDFDLDHEGHWGWLAGQLLVDAQSWAATYQPDIVLMHVGTNDMMIDNGIEDTKVEIGEIIDRLRLGQPNVTVLLAQLLPVAPSGPNSNITALNALLPQLAQQKSTAQSRILIVDQNTGFNPTTDTYDGIHLLAAGEAEMASRWYAALQPLLGPPPAPAHTLLVNVSGSGTVSRSPDQASYASGSTVTLTATPAAGQQFLGWSGAASGTTNPLSVTLTSDKVVTATFGPLPAAPAFAVVSFTLVNADTDQDIKTLTAGDTLTLSSLPTRNLNLRANTSPATVGSVVFSLSGAQARSHTESMAPYALFSDSQGDYFAWTPTGGSYSLTATPYAEGAGGGAAGTPLTLGFFVRDQPNPVFYALMVNVSGSGTVSRSPDQATYASGSVVTLTATPAAGQQFTGWSSDSVSLGTANPLNVTVTSSRVITARFGMLAAAPAFAVASFTLVNADTDQDIKVLSAGTRLNLAALPTRNLNVRANTSPATVGSVVFSLSGAQARSQTESVAPYALFSDASGDYNPWTPAVGAYSLTATPYSGAGGAGAAGTALTLSFSVIDSTAQTPAVTGLMLVNADTDADIQPMTDGMTLELAALPTRNLNIRAVTSSATVGSVVFALSGAQVRGHSESVAPYALFSDVQGDYSAWTPALGSYSLTATPYAGAAGAGAAGQPLALSFLVLEQKAAKASAAVPETAQVYPNPSSDGRFTVRLPRQRAAVAYTVVSAYGKVMTTGKWSVSQQDAPLTLDLARQLPERGLYYLLLESPGLHARLKLLRH
ncbi:repeat domain (List_Bact_rpt) [Hymenobacter daecheongensis DSM 21074]|uniref:Repeat domain (List_Bact_rpt) n=1 Tax=Hymenobacter daecheongensis DSM 21074 TaxID=1121955 RepID=A0A1M6KL50_9BACT|nr:GDSL-type esterase/lipase family protein [Hymenobacter daecheongensis]SHJ59590.1 repeat domain (List_Bact_rpt) [Hymenobacter daecheongensis DSM 21074]